GAEAGEARFARLLHPPGIAALRPAAAELRDDDNVLAARSERSSQELLGLPAAVDVGGVERRHAGLEGGVDHLPRSGFVDATAEIVAPEPRERDLQLADASRLAHRVTTPRRRPSRGTATRRRARHGCSRGRTPAPS